MPPVKLPGLTAVVLAAGAGTRFGGRKQLARLRGKALIEHALDGALAGPAERCLLVLGADAEEIAAALPALPLELAVCPDWAEGPRASLRTGLSRLGPECEAALVTLGDEPLTSPRAATRLLAWRGAERAALRARYRRGPGHPVLIERRGFEPLLAPGRERPERILAGLGMVEVPCLDLPGGADVDTVADLRELERASAADHRARP